MVPRLKAALAEGLAESGSSNERGGGVSWIGGAFRAVLRARRPRSVVLQILTLLWLGLAQVVASGATVWHTDDATSPGFLRTSRSGDLVIEFVASEAASSRIEFGLGTPGNHTLSLLQERRTFVTSTSVNMGYFPAGSRLDFYMSNDYGQTYWAHSSNLAGEPTPSDLATFRDTDGSLGHGGSVVQTLGPDDWILHLDDPVSYMMDDDDNDFVVRVRIIQPTARLGPYRVYEHPGGLHSWNQILDVKEKLEKGESSVEEAYEALIEQANAGLKREPHAVESFHVPPASESGEEHTSASERLAGDATAAYACALAWQLSKEPAYAAKARELLNAWAATNRRCGGKGESAAGRNSTLVMTQSGVALVHAAELISNCEDWTEGERAAFETWLRAVFVTACLERCRSEKEEFSNVSWALLGLVAAHHFLDDRKNVRSLIGWVRLEIEKQIGADGRLTSGPSGEGQDAWTTYFTLAPLTAACQIAWNAESEDLFHCTVNEDGTTVGVKVALDRLLRDCLGPDGRHGAATGDPAGPAPDRWPGNLFEAMAGIYGDPGYEAYVRDSRPHVMAENHHGWTFPTLMRPLAVETAPEKPVAEGPWPMWRPVERGWRIQGFEGDVRFFPGIQTIESDDIIVEFH